MDVTKNCVIEAKQGFDSTLLNHYVIIRVNAKSGDTIKINELNGLKYRELWGAFESPRHEDAPIVDPEKLAVIIGGEPKETKRTICIIGK